LQEIVSEGKTCAIIVKASFVKNGVNFVSKEDYPLQLGISYYTEGSSIKPHFHLNKQLVINQIQEIVHFESGRAIVNLYNASGEKFKSVELSAGDTIFFVEGGHGFTMLENTKLIEVKQGPYFGKEKDKEVIK
jgi:hypothetical protein